MGEPTAIAEKVRYRKSISSFPYLAAVTAETSELAPCDQADEETDT